MTRLRFAKNTHFLFLLPFCKCVHTHENANFLPFFPPKETLSHWTAFSLLPNSFTVIRSKSLLTCKWFNVSTLVFCISILFLLYKCTFSDRKSGSTEILSEFSQKTTSPSIKAAVETLQEKFRSVFCLPAKEETNCRNWKLFFDF